MRNNRTSQSAQCYAPRSETDYKAYSSRTLPSKSGDRGTELLVAEVAASQHGLITRVQLRECGVASNSITLRARDGRLHRIYKSVFAVGHAGLSIEARWLAVVLAVGDDTALSHGSAAALWGIWRGDGSAPHVVTARRHHGLPHAEVHSSRSLLRKDMTRRRGIPVTTVARTMLDLGDVLDAHQLANVLHEAAFRRKLNLRTVRDVMRRNRGRRAVTVLAHALELHNTGSAGTRSGLEDTYLAHLLDAGAAKPQVNTRIAVEDGHVEVDFHWPDLRLCVEVDGSGHERPRTRREDAHRDRRLASAGFTVLRCRPHEIQQHAERVANLTHAGGDDGEGIVKYVDAGDCYDHDHDH